MTMANKVGALIKEARTEAGLTQEQLARKVKDASASDIGKAERGEKELTQEQLKQIAKATGVTQKSLLDAAKSSSKKTASSSKTAEKKTASSSAKKTASSSSSGTSMKVTAAEKKLVELYRNADSDAKKKALAILKGEETDIEDILGSLLGGAGKAGKSADAEALLGSLLSGAKDILGKK